MSPALVLCRPRPFSPTPGPWSPNPYTLTLSPEPWRLQDCMGRFFVAGGLHSLRQMDMDLCDQLTFDQECAPESY